MKNGTGASKIVMLGSTNGPTTGYQAGYLVFDYHISRVEGKMLTLIEGLGLRDTQEKAVKDLARDIVQSLYREPQYLYGEVVGMAIEKQTALAGTMQAGSVAPGYTPAF